VDRKSDRSSLVGERPRDCLANPPRRVGRELEAEAPVELLHGANQAEVPLLDQVEQRDARLRVVTRDRHHEPEVRLDQLRLRGLVARVLALGELPLLSRRQQPAVADRPDVELERVVERRAVRGLGRGGLFLLLVVDDVELTRTRKHLEVRLRDFEFRFGLRKRPGRHRSLYRPRLPQTGSPVRGTPPLPR
jgi:hypothetical protein